MDMTSTPKSMALVDALELQHHQQSPSPSTVNSECRSPIESRGRPISGVQCATSRRYRSGRRSFAHHRVSLFAELGFRHLRGWRKPSWVVPGTSHANVGLGVVKSHRSCPGHQRGRTNRRRQPISPRRQVALRRSSWLTRPTMTGLLVSDAALSALHTVCRHATLP